MTDPSAPPGDSWQLVKRLFQAAIDQAPADRAAFVESQSPDSQIQAQVLRLLQWHEADQQFLDPLEDRRTYQPGLEPSQLIGRDLGGVIPRRVIGSGGMGTVFEADQLHPPRRVAVKILRLDQHDSRIAQRLDREALILAKLNHPGIAQIFAAGTCEIGGSERTWFAMEYIAGEPLLQYAQRAQLSRQERLDLFLALCGAVQHAHHRGVVHRDLKPENIMVRTGSAEAISQPLGLPVVLDFGVARVIDRNLPHALKTLSGQLIGTLAYMSPEQLSGAPELVDARSDVYALGVIGFELLVGQLPHDRKGSSIIEVLQKVANETPRRLSAFDRSLRGELDVIFAKAVEPDVERRYQSVAELARDVQAHLNHEPIQARPASLPYRAAKFLRRNRVWVGGVTATLLALLIGMWAYAREARRATAAARRAEIAAQQSRYEAAKATAVNEFLTNDFVMRLLESVDAEEGQLRNAALAYARQAATHITSTFSGKPLLEAAVRNELGTIFYNLRAADDAAAEYEQALRLWEQGLGPDHLDTLKAVNNLGQTRMLQRRMDEACDLYLRAFQGRQRVLGESHPATLATMINLAELHRGKGALDEAERWSRRALDGHIAELGKHHTNTIIAMANYGSLLSQKGELDRALELHREVFELSRETLGENHITALYAGSRLAQTLHRAGRHAEARDVLLNVLPSIERLFGPHHLETISPRRVLARVYRALGESALAVEQLQIALIAAQSSHPPQPQLIQRLQEEIEAAERHR